MLRHIGMGALLCAVNAQPQPTDLDAAGQNTLGTCNFTQYLRSYNRGETFDGYTLIGPNGLKPDGAHVYLMDMTGAVVHSWVTTEPASSCYPGFHLQPDGVMLRSYCPVGGLEGGGLMRVAWNGTVLWDTHENNIHHDAMTLPNGNILTSYFDVKTDEETAAAGARRPSNRTSDGIVELRPIGNNSFEFVWKWLFWDHLVQDEDPKKPNYAKDVGEHPERLDVNVDGSGGRAYSPLAQNLSSSHWCHMNAVDYNAELDQVIFSCRNLGEIFIIDHSTTTEEAKTFSGGRSGRGGDILWRWGNPNNYRRGRAGYYPRGDQQLFGQHDVHWVASDVPGRSRGSAPANTVMVYDNINVTFGNSTSMQRSTVATLQLPMPDKRGRYPLPKNGAKFLPEHPVSVWGEKGFSAHHISSAQRMGNGNTVVTNGETGQIVEVSKDGDIVWDWWWNGTSCSRRRTSKRGLKATLRPDDVDPDRFSTHEGACFFRTYRYPSYYPGLQGRNLTRPADCGRAPVAKPRPAVENIVV